jgi:thiosulfate reductase cytochrome b subunit
VRITHAIVSAAFFVLVFTGAEILMVHPRLYWGEAGNDLTPALVELPISRNYKHGGWDQKDTFANGSHPVISAARTYDIFNQNGWGRSLHFLAGWCLVAAGALYLFSGLITGHFLRNMLPRRAEQSLGAVWANVKSHLRGRIPPATGGPHYGLLQKCAYLAVIFLAFPGAVMTGFTMSPAITAAHPWLLKMWGGYQSARTVHFLLAVALVLFLGVHVVMIVKSGFERQLRAMTPGAKNG